MDKFTDKILDLIKNFNSVFSFKTPLVFKYFISFLIYNWKLFYIILFINGKDDNNFPLKLTIFDEVWDLYYVKFEFDFFCLSLEGIYYKLFFFPVISTLIYVTLYPYLAYLAKWVPEKCSIWWSNYRNKTELEQQTEKHDILSKNFDNLTSVYERKNFMDLNHLLGFNSNKKTYFAINYNPSNHNLVRFRIIGEYLFTYDYKGFDIKNAQAKIIDIDIRSDNSLHFSFIYLNQSYNSASKIMKIQINEYESIKLNTAYSHIKVFENDRELQPVSLSISPSS